MHFVFPAGAVSGLTIEEMVDVAADPGPLRFTSPEEPEVHIFVLSTRFLERRLSCVLFESVAL